MSSRENKAGPQTKDTEKREFAFDLGVSCFLSSTSSISHPSLSIKKRFFTPNYLAHLSLNPKILFKSIDRKGIFCNNTTNFIDFIRI
jgi:hypothetical protein